MKNADLKNKHNHALTQWLKVGIFSLLMLAPLIASVSQWIYATVNKNAKDSYSSKYIENTLLIDSNATLSSGLTYYFKWSGVNVGEGSTRSEFNYSDISIDWTDYGAPSGHNYDEFRIYLANQQGAFYLYLYENESLIYTFWEADEMNFEDFNFTASTDIQQYGIYNYQIYYFLLSKDTLDNAFYYGVDQMTKSDLFNWTQNTALYTGIKGMTDNLEIGTPAIAILITYWTILTIAYVIIDILITGFTWITHLIVRND